jgi:hypothetical protein
VQSLRKAGIDERHAVLSKLNSDQHSKEQEHQHMILFADGDEPRESKTAVLARLAPASTTPPAASTASSGFVVSPTVAAAGIALVAIVALIAFAVIRRNNNNNNNASDSDKSEAQMQHQLRASSSGVQLTDFFGPVMIQANMSTDSTMNQMGLEGIAASYNTTMQYQYQYQ